MARREGIASRNIEDYPWSIRLTSGGQVLRHRVKHLSQDHLRLLVKGLEKELESLREQAGMKAEVGHEAALELVEEEKSA